MAKAKCCVGFRSWSQLIWSPRRIQLVRMRGAGLGRRQVGQCGNAPGGQCPWRKLMTPLEGNSVHGVINGPCSNSACDIPWRSHKVMNSNNDLQVQQSPKRCRKWNKHNYLSNSLESYGNLICNLKLFCIFLFDFHQRSTAAFPLRKPDSASTRLGEHPRPEGFIVDAVPLYYVDRLCV